jgi:hypothetical protein
VDYNRGLWASRHFRKIGISKGAKAYQSLAKPQWLILGDFNMICKTQDKNNGRIDRKLIFRFTKTLNQMEVREGS